MSTSGGLWFSLLMVLLFGGLAFLRIKFPSPSKLRENIVLALVTAAFFALCETFLRS